MNEIPENKASCELRYETGICSITLKHCLEVGNQTCKWIQKAYEFGSQILGSGKAMKRDETK